MRCPEWRSHPLAIYKLLDRDRTLIEVSVAAEAEGIKFGMPLKEVELRCPQGVYLPDCPEKYKEAFSEVLNVLDRFSPSVEDAGVGLAFIDAAGLERLYGCDLELCKRIYQEVYESTGQTVWIGLTEGKFAAEVAARTSGKTLVNVIETDDYHYLAGQLVDFLPVSEKVLVQLRLLGIDTMDKFAALPRNSVCLRYGDEGLLAWRLAQGDDQRLVEGRQRGLVIEDIVEFEWEEHNIDRIAFALNALAERLRTQLKAQGKMAQRIRAEIGNADGRLQSFVISPPNPSVQARTFSDAVRWYLDATQVLREQTPSLDGIALDRPGIVFIRIKIEEFVNFEGKPLSLFANRTGRVERANRAMSRLRVELGDENVFRTKLCLEERRPERAFKKTDAYFEDVEVTGNEELTGMTHADPLLGRKGICGRWTDGRHRTSQQSARQEERYASDSGGMLRLLDLPVEVGLHERDRFRQGVQRSTWYLKVGGISRRVTTCHGPHKVVLGWWEDTDERDYFRMSLEDGVALLMYHELKSKRWYVQGVID